MDPKVPASGLVLTVWPRGLGVRGLEKPLRRLSTHPWCQRHRQETCTLIKIYSPYHFPSIIYLRIISHNINWCNDQNSTKNEIPVVIDLKSQIIATFLDWDNFILIINNQTIHVLQITDDGVRNMCCITPVHYECTPLYLMNGSYTSNWNSSLYSTHQMMHRKNSHNTLTHIETLL